MTEPRRPARRKPVARKVTATQAGDLVLDAACKHAVALIRAGQSPVPVLTAAGVTVGVLMGAER